MRRGFGGGAVLDFRKALRFPANSINWLLLLMAVFTPFIREGMDYQKAWEKKFYQEVEACRHRYDRPAHVWVAIRRNRH